MGAYSSPEPSPHGTGYQSMKSRLTELYQQKQSEERRIRQETGRCQFDPKVKTHSYNTHPYSRRETA